MNIVFKLLLPSATFRVETDRNLAKHQHEITVCAKLRERIKQLELCRAEQQTNTNPRVKFIPVC